MAAVSWQDVQSVARLSLGGSGDSAQSPHPHHPPSIELGAFSIEADKAFLKCYIFF